MEGSVWNSLLLCLSDHHFAVRILTSWPSLECTSSKVIPYPEVISKVISLCSGHWQWTFCHCVTVHSSHHKLSFEFQGPSNKQFKNWYWNSLQRQVKIHFWKIFKEIFLWSLYFLETQLYCWNLKTFRFVKTSSCNGHKESSWNCVHSN